MKARLRTWLTCALLCTVLLGGLTVLPQHVALAADGDPVQTIANPANSSIHVFDYWVYNSKGNSTTANNATGINHDYSGDGKDRNLWFWTSTDATSHGIWNHWTGYRGGATQGIVQPVLVDGYPALNKNVTGSKESLAYLFNSENIDADINGISKPVKRAYMNTNELYCVDENGYYTFNSLIHNGKLHTDPEDPEYLNFTVTEQTGGSFFPVTQDPGSSDSNPDGYFFGVHMQSEFSIPVNGMVLNPYGVYQEMVYEFTGDDDVWVYIDGVLIGDVGGIHSAQDLKINFATGEVVINNHEYPSASVLHTSTIYDLVVAAIGAEEAQDRFRWKQEDDGTYRTFASGTYHMLDFFYLERGGGRSNMRIKYNLISTYDFTAHKALHRGSSTDDQLLKENQFRYKLSGYPITDTDYPISDPAGTVIMEAVMPKSQPDDDVIWLPNYDPPNKPLIEENVAQEPFVKELIVGNAADGNINFGNAELTGGQDLLDTELGRYIGKKFRYIYEELPPEGAVYHEADGTYTYKGETVSPNDDGTYTFDGITYDNTKYYFEASVSPEGWINKTYYTDDTYSVRANVNFVNFTNLYNSTGKAVLTGRKRFLSAEGEELTVSSRQFSFKVTDITDPDNEKTVETGVGNDGAGKVTFSPMVYSLSEDLPGDMTTRSYIYRIEELPGNNPAIAYAGTFYYAKVTLTDNGDGTLKVDTQYYSDADCTQDISADDVVFVNRNCQTAFEIIKDVSKGATWPAGGTATFTLTPTGTNAADAPMPETASKNLTAPGSVEFSPIILTTDMAGKTFTYEIAETTDFPGGWTGSGPIAVTLAVDKAEDVGLTAAVTYDPEGRTITNTYKASGEIRLEAVKALKGAEWPEGKTLTLTLEGTGDAPMPESTTAVLSAAGNAEFGPIGFDESDAGKSYTYVISEDGFGSGWTGSGDITVTVKVKDNGNGTLDAAVKYSPEDRMITNTFDQTAEKYSFTFYKVWEGGYEGELSWTFYGQECSSADNKFRSEVIEQRKKYKYTGEFTFDPEGYYVIENIPEGYNVRYENVGAYAGVTDRLYDGGTMVNYKVPKTGDDASPLLWFGMVLSGLGISGIMAIHARKRRLHKR